MAVMAPDTGATTPTPSPAPSAPAPASTGETQATPQGAEATPETPKTVEIPDELIRQRIAEYDPQELKKLNRGFANIVGNDADRLAEKRLEARKEALRAEWEADWRNRQEAAELRQLRDTNPELYVQREKELEERIARQAEETNRIKSQVDAEVQAAREQSDNAIRAWAQSLPEPVQHKLREMGQIDEGDWAASRRKFMQVATELHGEYLRDLVRKDELPKEVSKEVERELAKRSKEIEAGVKSAQAAEAVAGEPAPDTGGGGATGTGPMTQEEFDSIRHDPALRKQHIDRIRAGVNAKLILR